MARKRREYSVAERRELWERWRRGESYVDFARALDRVPATIYCTIRRQGGVAPRERRRSRLALSFGEREEISRGIAAGRSARRIAAGLGRAASTVTREIDRHGGRSSYRAVSERGSRQGDHRSASWRVITRCASWLPRSWRRTGPPSRSPAG